MSLADDRKNRVISILKKRERAKQCSKDWMPLEIPSQGLDLPFVIKSMRDDVIDRALAIKGGNKEQASKLLGMYRTALVENLRSRGLIKVCPSKKKQHKYVGVCNE